MALVVCPGPEWRGTPPVDVRDDAIVCLGREEAGKIVDPWLVRSLRA